MRFAITAAIIARFTIAITPTIAVKYRLAIAGEECFAMLSFAMQRPKKGKSWTLRLRCDAVKKARVSEDAFVREKGKIWGK